MKLIENEEQYDKCHAFLIKTAALLDDPLADQETKNRQSEIYDRTAKLMQYYQRGVMARESKAMRRFYDKHRIKYQEFAE